jgi:hypothetical protein
MRLSLFKRAPQAHYGEPKREALFTWLNNLRNAIDIQEHVRVRVARVVFSTAVVMAVFMIIILVILSFGKMVQHILA